MTNGPKSTAAGIAAALVLILVVGVGVLFGFLHALPVLFAQTLRFGNHSLDLLLAVPPEVIFDHNVCLRPCGLVLGCHRQQSADIDFEGHVNLWDTLFGSFNA
mmetsp:Transcript_22412/g.38171  ORF Transcript_22412/g.38171 Transcript_22412/m.38171 type:complete len:103 (-) Transcript_22412:1879-2187(-)